MNVFVSMYNPHETCELMCVGLWYPKSSMGTEECDYVNHSNKLQSIQTLDVEDARQ